MPFKPKAQQKYFQYLESKGKMPKQKMAYGGMVDHMQEGEDRAPHDMEEMPDYEGNYAYIQQGVKEAPEYEEEMPHFARGGIVPENYDRMMGDATEFDSTGEPHTEDKLEDEDPMEFMARGGRVKRMAKGGMVRSKFANALRKMR